MKQVPELLDKGIRVIDLAADFRIRDQATWGALVWHVSCLS